MSEIFQVESTSIDYIMVPITNKVFRKMILAYSHI